jgi:predicted nucleic acid binding AN1-type Zn finger protein
MNYCTLCKKKINTVKTITNKCKCNNLFCDKHLFYKDHDCKFNYIEEFKNNSSNNILELSKLSNKIIKI